MNENQYIPVDQKLGPEWVKSLFERGQPTTYTKSRNELRYIGMPVGGICCGTLYLGGDGRLWNWDIFNQKTAGVLPRRVSADVGMNFQTGDNAIRPQDGATYVKPAVQADSQKIEQGFAIRVTSAGQAETRRLDASGWAEVSFTGQYPIGTVEYHDPASPVAVKLEAFSPFVALEPDDSGLPATVFHFTVTNRGAQRAVVNLAGWMQNATSFHSAQPSDGARVNQVKKGIRATLVAMRFQRAMVLAAAKRPDLLVEDFEHGYGAWKIEGSAFGSEPASRAAIPPYQGEVGGEGGRVVNSHASAPGQTVGAKDDQTGKITSAPFKVQRKFLSFYIGGGRREDVGLRLLVDGQGVRKANGRDNNRMRHESFDVAEFEGREAVLEVFDAAKGGWGNVGVDHIVQTDEPKTAEPLERKPDFGTFAFGLIGKGSGVTANPDVSASTLPDGAFAKPGQRESASGQWPLGVVARELTLTPGQSAEVRFVLAWHFPKTTLPVPDARTGNYYAKRFSDATAVVTYLATELPRLESATRRWRDTWYDSTLPHWFLERTFVNTSILATTTAHRFTSGRFWGWEGIGCCEGTCTHVCVFHPDRRSEAREESRHLRGLSHRPSAWPELGLAGQLGAGVGSGEDLERIAGVVETQLRAGRRALPQEVHGWPALCARGRCRAGHDFQSEVDPECLRPAQLADRLLQRVHERLRTSGRFAHGRRRPGAGRVRGDPRHPRSLPRVPSQPFQRNRVQRPLRPRHGQLRHFHLRVRFRVSWTQGSHWLRAPSDAGKLPRAIHGRRRVGHLSPEAHRHHPAPSARKVGSRQ